MLDNGMVAHVVMYRWSLTQLVTLKSPNIDAQAAKLRRARCRATSGINSAHRAMANEIPRYLSSGVSLQHPPASTKTTIISKA